jgi:hypothetical protein
MLRAILATSPSGRVRLLAVRQGAAARPALDV